MAFVPTFSRTLEDEGHSRLSAVFFSLFFLFSLAGVLVVIMGIIFAPVIITLIAPGFVTGSYTYNLTLILLKIMLPYFWLISITALCMGVLNALGNFGMPALAPVMFNLVVIGFTLLLVNYFDTPIMGLAVGVVLGGSLQVAVQIPMMVRLGILTPAMIQTFRRFPVFSPSVVNILKTMVPCMIGAASFQVNMMTASFFASKLDPGSVSSIYYADRLVQFPLALFAVSTATVLLPELSKKSAIGRDNEIAALFSNGVRLVLFVTIPAMAGLMALNEEIIALLFGYGAFDESAIQKTADCLLFLVPGLWAFTGIRLFVTLHYALGSIKIPFVAGIFSIGLNLVLCCLVLDILGLRGLVLSVSISGAAGFVFLFLTTPGAVRIHKLDIFLSACRSVFLSVIMFFLVKRAAIFILPQGYGNFWFGAGVTACIGLGVIFYLGINLLVAGPELKMIKTKDYQNKS
jgi:putative peptidoglycan lipid II flippase